MDDVTRDLAMKFVTKYYPNAYERKSGFVILSKKMPDQHQSWLTAAACLSVRLLLELRQLNLIDSFAVVATDHKKPKTWLLLQQLYDSKDILLALKRTRE